MYVHMYVCTCYSEQFSILQSGVMISSQISNKFLQLPENGHVLLKFNIVSYTYKYSVHMQLFIIVVHMRLITFCACTVW